MEDHEESFYLNIAKSNFCFNIYFWCFFIIHLLLQVVNAADEIINSVNREELAKYFSQKSDPEDDSAEVSSNYY